MELVTILQLFLVGLRNSIIIVFSL